MLLTVLLFLLGLILLIAGGEALVRGAGALARSAGVPPVAIGLTVVAFGTSAPELIVAVTGALRGAEGVSFGNVVGANIVNIAFIIGATALIMPLTVNSIVVTREIPMAGLAMLATVVLSFDALFGSGPDRLTRGDGFLLLLLFGVFLYYTVRAMRRRKDDQVVQAAAEFGWQMRVRSLAIPIGTAIVGFAGLALGGNLLVDSAVTMATAMGMTPAAVGLTIVAIGTTMPELTTALLAVRKGETDLAVGNVVGSNIFNVLVVLGTAAAISPIDVSPRSQIALLIATGLTLLLLALCTRNKDSVQRRDGVLLLAVFVTYMAWMFLAA
ncbi:MAG: calcium/sodium antiporter [Chloroflexi bacterium]|nr:calcium/sodium antiporter [Chloroflexota bacterium]